MIDTVMLAESIRREFGKLSQALELHFRVTIHRPTACHPRTGWRTDLGRLSLLRFQADDSSKKIALLLG